MSPFSFSNLQFQTSRFIDDTQQRIRYSFHVTKEEERINAELMAQFYPEFIHFLEQSLWSFQSALSLSQDAIYGLKATLDVAHNNQFRIDHVFKGMRLSFPYLFYGLRGKEEPYFLYFQLLWNIDKRTPFLIGMFADRPFIHHPLDLDIIVSNSLLLDENQVKSTTGLRYSHTEIEIFGEGKRIIQKHNYRDGTISTEQHFLIGQFFGEQTQKDYFIYASNQRNSSHTERSPNYTLGLDPYHT